jgi:hypothetical protein
VGLSVNSDKSFPYPVASGKLHFRYLTARESGRLVDTLDAAIAPDLSVAQTVDQTAEALRIALVGWEVNDDGGNSVAYDPAKLADVLTLDEVYDLRRELLYRMGLSHREKKVSALSPQSTTDNSAKPATASA